VNKIRAFSGRELSQSEERTARKAEQENALIFSHFLSAVIFGSFHPGKEQMNKRLKKGRSKI